MPLTSRCGFESRLAHIPQYAAPSIVYHKPQGVISSAAKLSIRSCCMSGLLPDCFYHRLALKMVSCIQPGSMLSSV
jgi:hypothetical protein